MQKFLGALFFIILFVACKKERPEGVLNQKRMTQLLFDMHLADAYTMTGVDSVRAQAGLFYQSIYEKYGIDSASFKRNMEYYAAHPGQLQDIYAEISKRYRSLEQVYIKQQEEENQQRFKADSILRVHRADSIKRLEQDSLRYARIRYLLYWKSADSTHLRPPAWNLDSAMAFWEEQFFVKSAKNPVAPPAPKKPLLPK